MATEKTRPDDRRPGVTLTLQKTRVLPSCSIAKIWQRRRHGKTAGHEKYLSIGFGEVIKEWPCRIIQGSGCHMFIIAGVSPKTTTLDHHPRRCPACGLFQAYLKRTDSYFSLFFLPLFPVKKGEPYLWCKRCNHLSHETQGPRPPGPPDGKRSVCRACGKALDRQFGYCPYCGNKQS